MVSCCIFANNSSSRPGNKSPRYRAMGASPTSNGGPEDGPLTRRSSLATTEASTPTVAHSQLQINYPSPAGRPISPSVSDTRAFSETQTPTKRARIAEDFAQYGLEPSPQDLDARSTRPNVDLLGFDILTDPVAVDRDLVDLYLAEFFQNINLQTFGIFPRTRFTHWVHHGGQKTMMDRTVLYAMLTFATVFSQHAERANHRQAFSAIAHQGLAQTTNAFSVQFIQAGLTLTLVDFASGKYEESFDISRRVGAASSWLRLYTEEVVTADDGPLYGLTGAALAECKRRTFWSTYITDCFGSACRGRPISLNRLDIVLRLPCAYRLYDSDEIPVTPYFDGEAPVPSDTSERYKAGLGSMAYLAQIATLACEIRAVSRRSKNKASMGCAQVDDRSARFLEQQLDLWERTYTRDARQKSVQRGNGTDKTSEVSSTTKSNNAYKFSGLHINYHFAQMELNRYVQHSRLAQHRIIDQIRKAHSHAVKTLEIVQQLIQRGGTETPDYRFALISPLTAYAIFSAVDIMTSLGRRDDVLEHESRTVQLLYSGIELLSQLADKWHSTKIQLKLVQDRCSKVIGRVSTSVMARKIAFFTSKPMAPTMGEDFDLIYGVDRLQHLRALGWEKDIETSDDLLDINSS